MTIIGTMSGATLAVPWLAVDLVSYPSNRCLVLLHRSFLHKYKFESPCNIVKRLDGFTMIDQFAMTSLSRHHS